MVVRAAGRRGAGVPPAEARLWMVVRAAGRRGAGVPPAEARLWINPLQPGADGGSSMRHRVAAIPGDGIGKEVVPEGMRVLDAAGRRFGFDIEWTTFVCSCERSTETGRMMPEDGLDRLRAFESIFLGAVGFPGVPDHVSLWGLLI